MILPGLILLFVGLLLSAFFSGSETGFYRASRVRLVMDAIQKRDLLSRSLLFLTNRPPLFVATALVGNNSANYLTSMAIVLLANAIFGSGVVIEMAASICMSPIVFVYGELMPKYLYYRAPNRLLRSTGHFLVFFAILFAPLSAILWMLGLLLERICGQSPAKVRLALARNDLGDIFMQGQDAGLLQPTQLQLSQNFFLVAMRPVTDWMKPLTSKTHSVHCSDISSVAIDLARKHKLTEIPVTDENKRDVVGYLRMIDLLVTSEPQALTKFVNPLVNIQASALHSDAIMQMQASKELMARVVDDEGTTLGLVTLDALLEPLSEDALPILRGGS